MKYEKYTPVDPDFYDIISNQSEKSGEMNIFFFKPDNEMGQAKGEYKELMKAPEGEFINFFGDDPVRLDRIITLNGKPGPAFDEYDAYANACLSCQAGYDD